MSQIINELLCVLKCNYGKYPRAELIATFTEFYTDDEIEEAKSALLDFADKCSIKVDELKNVKPRVGDGRGKRN